MHARRMGEKGKIKRAKVWERMWAADGKGQKKKKAGMEENKNEGEIKRSTIIRMETGGDRCKRKIGNRERDNKGRRERWVGGKGGEKE